MSSKEMKQQLIEKIKLTDDDKILEEVYRILNLSTSEVDEIILSDFQKNKIESGLQDIENGRYLSNDEAGREIEEWLKK